MIIFSQALVLSEADNLNTPIFGWRSVATPGTIAATSEEAANPAINLGNPSTALFWRAGAAASPPGDSYLTATINQIDEIDYVAVAAHNFGSAAIRVSLELATALEGSPPALNWTEIVPDALLGNDEPLLYRITPTSIIAARLRLQPGTAPPQAAVLHVGRLLVMPRGTSESHVPVNLARMTRKLSASSLDGHFLGNLVLSESRRGAIPFKHLDRDWYRANVDPFVVASQVDPFFFAWKPQELPADVGYCTMTNDPQPVHDFDTGTVAVDLQMEGAAV